jgi:hypothetical protein
MLFNSFVAVVEESVVSFNTVLVQMHHCHQYEDAPQSHKLENTAIKRITAWIEQWITDE